MRQVQTVTIAGTPAATETVTLTMNTKDLIVTVGTADTSAADVASAIRNAWNAISRLDGTTSPDAASNFGGQEHGEFSEVTASINTAAPTVVILTASTASRPFTVTVAEAMGTGTATLATTQAATGPEHWDNADNWDTITVPANDDVVVFRDSAGSFRYGLPNGSLEVTIQTYNSWTGQVGLPRINATNHSKTYQEYRQRYVRLDDAGTGADVAHRFGIGKDGTGFTLFNVKHSTLKCSPIVYNTGTPQISGTHALNICCAANTSTLTILNGSVDYSSQDSGTSAFARVSQRNGDSRGIQAVVAGGDATISGGTALIGGTGALAAVEVIGGTLRLEGQTGTITTLTARTAGVIQVVNMGTATAMLVLAGGTFDARNAVSGFILTQGDVYEGGSFLDPYALMSSAASTVQVHYDPSPQLQFGATVSNPLVIAT